MVKLFKKSTEQCLLPPAAQPSLTVLLSAAVNFLLFISYFSIPPEMVQHHHRLSHCCCQNFLHFLLILSDQNRDHHCCHQNEKHCHYFHYHLIHDPGNPSIVDRPNYCCDSVLLENSRGGGSLYLQPNKMPMKPSMALEPVL